MVSAKKKTSKVAEDSPAAEVAEDSPAAEDAAATEEKTPVAADAAESAGDGESAAEAKASADEGEKAEGEEAKSAPAAEEAAKDENEGEGEDTTGADAAAAGDGEDPPPGSQLEQDIIKAEKKAGDIFPAGACKKEIKSFCEGVDVGNRSLERCLSDSFKLTKAADAASADKKFGKKCLKAIRRFKIEVYKDISIDKEMMEVCKDDISSLCDDDFLYPEVGSVLACLRCVPTTTSLPSQPPLKPLPKVTPVLGNGGALQCNGAPLNLPTNPRTLPLTLVPTLEAKSGGKISEAEAKSGGKISEACGQKVFEAQQDAANDFVLDPQLNETCSGDVQRLCADVPTGEGRVQDCLVGAVCGDEGRDHRNSLNWECLAELFRQEIESSEDIRLNTRLFKACLEDKRRFCPDVLPGDARVKDCLESHLHDSDFSKTWAALTSPFPPSSPLPFSFSFQPLLPPFHFSKGEFEHMMERRASHFCLDVNKVKFEHMMERRAAGKVEFEHMMERRETLMLPLSYSPPLSLISSPHFPPLAPPRSKVEFEHMMERRASDFRLDFNLRKYCAEDISTTCYQDAEDVVDVANRDAKTCYQDPEDVVDVANRDAKVIECLQGYCGELTPLPSLPSSPSPRCSSPQTCYQDAEDAVDVANRDVKTCYQDAEDVVDAANRDAKTCYQDAEDVVDVGNRDAKTCYQDAEDVVDVANRDAKVIECLQDYRGELKDPRCRQQVHQLTKRASEDIRFNRPLAQACKDDSAKLCKDVPPGHARVLLCLQEHRKGLTANCKEALFQEEVRFAEDIDFKFPLRQACTDEMKILCKDQPDVIKCLQDKVEDADMGVLCKEEVKKDMKRAAEDYRLNFRLNKECFVDVERLCLHSCDAALETGGTETGVTCGGATLKCLTENERKLSSKTCRQELFYFKKRMVADISLDIPLQMACKNDVEKKCGGERDHSKALACLRAKRDELTEECKEEELRLSEMELSGLGTGWVMGKRDELTEECKEEELRLSEMEASDIRLTPTLMNACGLELNHFCRGVHPTTGLAFRCLQMSINEMSIGEVRVMGWCSYRVMGSRPPNLPPRLLLQAGLGALPEQCEGTPLPLLLVNPTLLLYPSPPPHQVGMSVACKAEVDLQTFRHASYYKLDSALAEQCEGDVDSFCKGVDEGKEAHSLVLQCLDADLVKPCNPVVEELCGNRTGVVAGEGAGKAGAAAAVGVVGQCLLEQPKEKLGEECGRLVGLIGQPGGHVGGVIDTSQLEETLAQLAQVQLKHEVDAETEGEGGGGGKLVLTGATAFAAVTALTAVLLGAAYLVYRKCFDPTRNYTLMVKAGDV
ncbi:unnamed protein product [Closterium sp. NIES-64]|nr:unnamed protein product [Closterium sp. NIES-64]